MTQPEFASFEAGNRPRRLKGLIEHDQWTIEDLRGDAVGIGELNQSRNTSRLGFLGGAGGYRNPGLAQLLCQSGHRLFSSYFPADVCQVIFAGRMNDEAMMILVHAQE